MKQKIEIEVDVPDGWEWTGEYRRAMQREKTLGFNPSRVIDVLQPMGTETEHFILRRREPVRESRWVNAYGRDVGNCSRYDAEASANHLTRQGVIRLDYEDGKLVHVTLEEVSDG